MGVNEDQYRAAETRLWAHEGVEPEERWIDLPTSGLRVRVQLVGEGPPVLFVHGAAIGGTCWAPLVSRLAGWRAIVLDRPGCGLSAPPPGAFADVEAYGAFADSLLVDVLDALDVERADLVSSSLGGWIGFHTAAAHPERVNRIVQCGWTVGAPLASTPWLMRLLSGTPRLGRLLMALPVTRSMTLMTMRQAGLSDALDAGRVPPEMIDWWHALLSQTDTMRNEITGAPPIMHPIHGVNDSMLLPDELLARVKAPVSFIWGTEDLFAGEAIASAFAARLPEATLEMVPAGHGVWIDDPDPIAASVRAGLTSPARPEGPLPI
jgi:pimeloyl-ACP methyl ester carboxylesterase